MGVWIGRRVALAALAVLLAGFPAAAQEAQPASPHTNPARQLMIEACAHVPQPAHVATGLPTRISDAQIYRTLHRLADMRQGQATVVIPGVETTGRWPLPSLAVTVRPGQDVPRRPDPDPASMEATPAPEAWKYAFFTVFVRPAGRPATGDMDRDGAVRANTFAFTPPRAGDAARTGEAAADIVVPLEFRPRRTLLPQNWEILVLPCLRANKDDRLTFAAEFGRAERLLIQPVFGAVIGFGGALLSLFVLGLAAARINRHQLASTDTGERPMRRFDPCFICQDAFGYMSLSRFQVFLFTLALLGVVGYAFVMTQRIPNLDPTVLILAGITFGGSTLAAAATKPLVETGNRLWLLGNGILDAPRRRPRWSDLLTGDGEVDITRVQALAFTCFAVVSMVWNGTQDIENFRIPEQLNYLIGLSQTVYVAGKALPADAPRRLNEELRSVRMAERALLDKPGDAAAIAEFRRQTNGIATSLTDVFGERFLRPQLDLYQRRVLTEAEQAAATLAAVSIARAAAASGGTVVETTTTTLTSG
jgi:hypothetical protein